MLICLGNRTYYIANIYIKGGQRMKAICLAKKCVYRTYTENGTYYCPFGKCPFNKAKEINNDRKRAEQPILHRTENKKA